MKAPAFPGLRFFSHNHGSCSCFLGPGRARGGTFIKVDFFRRIDLLLVTIFRREYSRREVPEYRTVVFKVWQFQFKDGNFQE